LYGASPINNKTGLDFGLKPIMTLKSKIISVNRLKKGQSIGYNAQFTLTKDTTVGVVAMGYGDGYPLTAGDGTPILVKGKIC
jgi:alanine racemase